MEYFLLIIVAIILGIIIYQDLNFRHIHVSLPIFIFAITYYLNSNNTFDMLKSIGFLVINFIAITIYYSLKKSEITNPFQSQIGLGDLVFLIGIIPMFSFRNYILFFITGMLFTLALYALFSKKYSQKTIPLAGYLSIYLVVLLTTNSYVTTNIFYDILF